MKIVGEGKQSVYVYYFKSYKEHADNYYWPCKIGMSRRSVIKRVEEQIKTGLPEYPVIALIIKIDNAADLEKLLHSFFRLKQRNINAPGKEWFFTTPEEVLNICQILRIF